MTLEDRGWQSEVCLSGFASLVGGCAGMEENRELWVFNKAIGLLWKSQWLIRTIWPGKLVRGLVEGASGSVASCSRACCIWVTLNIFCLQIQTISAQAYIENIIVAMWVEGSVCHWISMPEAILAFLYLCDRTSVVPDGPKVRDPKLFWGLWVLIVFIACFTIRRTEDSNPLSREQTDEWKGWMQIMFLMWPDRKQTRNTEWNDSLCGLAKNPASIFNNQGTITLMRRKCTMRFAFILQHMFGWQDMVTSFCIGRGRASQQDERHKCCFDWIFWAWWCALCCGMSTCSITYVQCTPFLPFLCF